MGNEIREAARGKIQVRTWMNLCMTWGSNRRLEQWGGLKTPSPGLDCVESVMMISHPGGNQVYSKREVWILGKEDGNRNFNFGLTKSWRRMSLPGIDCG